MKNKLFSTLAIMSAVLLLLANTMRDPNNPPAGRTGAPGETTCGASGCHSGGSYTGTVSISGVPDTVTPSTTYTITLTNATNAVRAGFELTCLDGSNAMCGTLTAGSGSSITSGSGGRKYVRQSSPKNLSNGTTSWTFTWKSPAASDSATFYFVSLCANGNGQKTGDNPITATKSVKFQSTTPAFEPGNSESVKIYPTVVTNGLLHIELQQAASGQLSILDMQGKKVLDATISSANELSISNLPPGMYLANIAVGGKTVAKKFIVK